MIAVTSTHSPPTISTTDAQTLVDVTTLIFPISPSRVRVGFGLAGSPLLVQLM